MEWDAARRAQWLYHNRHTIETAAYQEGLKDAAVAAEIARLEAEKVAANPNYVDKEFEQDPSLMYEQEYIEAAYNPTVVPPASSGFLKGFLIFMLIVIVGGLLFYVTFVHRFGGSSTGEV